MPAQSGELPQRAQFRDKVILPMSRNCCAVCAVFVAAVLSISAVAQAPPSADAYVTSTQPEANFGGSAFLPVQVGTTSYIRLNLGVFPAGSTVAKATLRLYVNAVAAPGSFDVYQLGSGWTEKGVTSNSAPPLGPSATGGRPVAVTAASANQFIVIDITGLAQSWLSGSTPNYGIALVLTSSNGSFSFDSKESTGTGHQPELEVILAGGIGTVRGVTTEAIASPNAKNTVGQQMSDPYIDNETILQTGANFNIDGAGSAATFNATSEFLLAGVPVLGSSGNSGLFLGPSAGQSNSGTLNTFLGVSSGQLNTTGSYNTFSGTQAGQNNLTGSNLTFLGAQAGSRNTSGSNNTFLGMNAGYLNGIGSYNTLVGSSAGTNSLAANYNTFMGYFAGVSNQYGSLNTFVGAQAGVFNRNGGFNSMIGVNAGYGNTSGSYNTFLGMNAGVNTVSGNHNTYIGFTAGQNADPAASNNLYLASVGAAGESGAIRIGDASNQTAAYVAGTFGSSTNSGVPVFIDSTGKLGTGGGAVSFTQVTGTLSSPQFTGTYSNSVTLSNPSNVIDGSFTGNGSGLTGVSSGLSWPIVLKSADYTIQAGDFSTPTSYGNYLILTGSVAHTFTLPNPSPPNGECVAIDNNAGAPINSNTNVFLTVSANGLTIDGGAPNTTQPKRNSYLYCSDGTNYWRLDRQLASPSQIGPVLYTVDTGPVNALQTTFVAGLDLGLNTGTEIFILPVHANTILNPTLNVNGLGAKKILKYGNQGLAPGDLSPTALAVLIYDGQYWELVNPQTTIGTVTSVTATSPLVSSGGSAPVLSCPTCITSPTLTGTTGTIGGNALTAGSCSVGTANVVGAAVGHPVSVSASDGSLPNPLIILSAAVTSANVVTVQLCATAQLTPAANTYNVATQ